MKSTLILCAGLVVAGCAMLAGPLTRESDARAETGLESAEQFTQRGAATGLDTIRVASGLVRPIFAGFAPGDFTRLFIIEKQGRIRILNLTTGMLLPTAFLDIDPIVGFGTSDFDERGLLGLAFHPQYNTMGSPNNGVFFVYYTDTSSDTRIVRLTRSANPDIANNPGGAPDTILFMDQPFSNHNGGWIEFGSDGFLYVAPGDGGDRCDPFNNAQNRFSLFGKMLRIDVNSDAFPADVNRDYAIPASNPFSSGATGAMEVWHYGLRNSWRNCFDRATGDLYIADVGQNIQEEINFIAGNAASGLNFGWDCEEGLVCSSGAPSNCSSTGCTCGGAGFTDPVHVYDHLGGRCSITGGRVYRGCAIPDLAGTYFYADVCSNQIWSLEMSGGVATNIIDRTAELAPGGGLTLLQVTSFGEDAYGEIYLCDQTGGEVFKIVPSSFIGPDCNANARRDACDILSGASPDANHNGVPDECDPPPCPFDLNGDGVVGSADLALLLGDWNTFGSGGLAGLLGSWGDCPT